MLVAGVVLGVILGPAVLGRLAPTFYDPMFVGSGDTADLQAAEAELDSFVNDEDRRIEEINKVMAQFERIDGANDSMAVAQAEQLTALTHHFADQEQARRDAVVQAAGVIEARKQTHLAKLSGMATAMLLLVVMLFAGESILSPQRDEIEQGKANIPPALARLVTIRYALMAGWLMLMLAQPAWLRGIDPIFGGLLLAVVLLAGLVPLGKQK